MQPELRPAGSPFGAADTAVVRQNRVLRNTYALLALTLIPTVIGAVVGTNIDMSFMRTNPIISFIVVLAVFYGWIFAIEKNRDSALGVGLLLGFTGFLGLLLGPLLKTTLGFSNGSQLVAMAAGGTAAVFFGLAGIASNVKRDFSNMAKFITIGVIVIMLAVVANLFFQSPALHLTLLCGFILLSSAILLYQINAIVRGGETNYVSATLSIYISIYNIFSSLLQLLGIFGGNRD